MPKEEKYDARGFFLRVDLPLRIEACARIQYTPGKCTGVTVRRSGKPEMRSVGPFSCQKDRTGPSPFGNPSVQKEGSTMELQLIPLWD
jgi:hypothetical protein